MEKQFLTECIESVLRQTYGNYEYIIVNNCSTDRSLDIALNYSKSDSRIRAHSNSQFVGVIENHNIAFRLISANSKYCKVVSADDWLFPDCIARMVGVAERIHPPALLDAISSVAIASGGRGSRIQRLFFLAEISADGFS